jgi:hypothetical protein
MSEFEILESPSDGISSLNFSNSNSIVKLLATSWDSKAYIYDIKSNTCISKFSTESALLDGLFSKIDDNFCYVGGLSRQINK